MKTETKSVIVKGYNKKHTFEVEKMSISGYNFITFKKNGNPVLKCTPKDFELFKTLFK